MKKTELKAPVAKKIPRKLEKHGDVRIDNYFWLREREKQDVLEYLNEENQYFKEMTSGTKDFQEDLFHEMKQRIKEDDSSVPYKFNGYWYITKFEKGKNYPVYFRRKDVPGASREEIFDVNEMAGDSDFYSLSGISISPDNRLAAFAVDDVGRRNYTIRIKDLQTGKLLPEEITCTTGGSTWANDNKTLFYARKDEETLRSNEIYRHILGAQPNDDKMVFKEYDETFHSYVYKSKSRKYIIIGSDSTLTSEYRILKADDPHGKFRIVQARIRGLEYTISHFEKDFYILTNKDGAVNFKLMKTPVEKTTMENWTDVIPHNPEVLLEDMDIFKNYLVLSERKNGLNRIQVIPWESKSHYISFEGETYTAYTGNNPEFNTDILRYSYNSLTQPVVIIDYNMKTGEKKVMKEQEVLGGKFDKNNYTSERIWATAEDGTKIPMSLVCRKDLKMDGKNPLVQYAYGSYGSTIDPYFSTVRLSLLDRGFIFVLAHVRGGEYLGRQWYEDGKLLKKKNTFTDFIDCSLHLIEKGYTSADHLYASGGSAGGLLVGAVINMAPHLYQGVIAAVPFVDVVTTMLDQSIPLTTGEFDEWGNPELEEYYFYMKSYSPYDNVIAQDYPNMLVTAGFHDSQVQYWEPAKWVAKLRELKTDDNVIYLDTNMEAGHGGPSGRYDSLKEIAEEYAFLLNLEEISE